jgi:hypothetical protein
VSGELPEASRQPEKLGFESHTGVAPDDAGPNDKPYDRSSSEGAHEGVDGQDAHRGEPDGGHDEQRHAERLEPGDDDPSAGATAANCAKPPWIPGQGATLYRLLGFSFINYCPAGIRAAGPFR